MSHTDRLEEHRALSFVLAVLMHGLIAAMLFFGLQWHTKPAAPTQVELWAGELEASPKPETEVRPTPPTPRHVNEPETQHTKRPDIAEEKPKPVKQPEKLKPEPKPEPVKKVEPPKQPEQKKPEPQPSKTSPKTESGQGKLESDKAGKLKAPPIDASAALNALEKRQQAAEASAAAKAFEQYMELVRNKIRRNMSYPDDGAGNPEAEFEVRLLPDMTVLDAKLIRSSGSAAFDEAALRAILRAAQYPPLPAEVEFRTLRQHKLKYRLKP
ncbi:TonB family protein [Chitinimonas sp. PSY-7]|uniref:TonB family protein n=1 Tax=Chitinimonas sp. PSY-7 TaxID=3459088 RepID=UPI00404033DC